MKHYPSPDFWKCYNRLPPKIQNLAKNNFSLLKADPEHPSLHLKKMAACWSVRIGLRH